MPPKCAPDHNYCDAGPTSVAPKRWWSRSRVLSQAGYRLFDTAAGNGNEEGVGRAIVSSGLPRDEVFVTAKLWNLDQGYDETLAAFDRSPTPWGWT